MKLKKLLKEQLVSLDKWWTYSPSQVMSFVYRTRGQTPPSNKTIYQKIWKGLKLQLIKKYPPSTNPQMLQMWMKEQMVWTPGGGENGVESDFPPEKSPTNKIREYNSGDIFNKIYAEFDKKDYFGKESYEQTLLKNNKKSGYPRTGKEIYDFVNERMYNDTLALFNKLKAAIVSGHIDWLRANVRPDQKFLSRCFEELTGYKLGTNAKSYADVFEKTKLREETMQGEAERADINLANRFAEMLGDKIKSYYIGHYPNVAQVPGHLELEMPKVKPGAKYIKIDAQRSGKFMLGPGNHLYFIKAYGVPDLKKDFGNLADIIKADFDFDGYSIVKKGSHVRSAYGYAGPITEGAQITPELITRYEHEIEWLKKQLASKKLTQKQTDEYRRQIRKKELEIAFGIRMQKEEHVKSSSNELTYEDGYRAGHLDRLHNRFSTIALTSPNWKYKLGYHDGVHGQKKKHSSNKNEDIEQVRTIICPLCKTRIKITGYSDDAISEIFKDHLKVKHSGHFKENVALPIVRKKLTVPEKHKYGFSSGENDKECSWCDNGKIKSYGDVIDCPHCNGTGLAKLKKKRGEGMDDRGSGYFMERIYSNLNDAITPEERKVEADFGAMLKNILKKDSDLSSIANEIRVRVIPSQRPNTWIQVWTHADIPNEFRVKVAKALGITGILNWDNVNYGNIRSNGVSLQYSEWKKLVDKKIIGE